MTNSTPQHEHTQLNTLHVVSSLSDEFLSLLVDELNTENVTALALVGSYALSTLLTPCPICCCSIERCFQWIADEFDIVQCWLNILSSLAELPAL